MTTTRSQAARADKNDSVTKSDDKKRKDSPSTAQPRKKAPKVKEEDVVSKANANRGNETIERGHVYFFYRPRVQLEKAHSLDEVRNLHMLLIPRPPLFATYEESDKQPDDEGMKLLEPGADAVPAPQPQDASQRQPYRLLTIGKKKLPDSSKGGAGKGKKEAFWAVVTKVGDDLHQLEQGLGEQSYETKTLGTRHEGPARLAGRGGYAIVVNSPRVPSQKASHLGYCLSHPTDLGPVQEALGIEAASSFVLQVKNPLAPAMAPGQANAKGANYPADILDSVFGRGSKGREDYGLRFAACDKPDLLDYEGAQVLLIGAHSGQAGLEESLGEARGEALEDEEYKESMDSINQVFQELGLDKEIFSTEPLKGRWI